MDVGGGLGIDYEGTRSRSYCSINYGVDAVRATASCSRWPKPATSTALPPPRIVTECGRAMTAHHAVLVANVSEVEEAPEGRVPPAHDDEPAVIRHLREIHDELDQRPAVELFHDAQHHHGEGLSLYALGQIDLAHRARIDDLFYAIAHAVRARLDVGEKCAPRRARRTERAPGRQVLRQLQRVRVDAGRVGDRPGVPDRADRAPRRSADAPRRDRRHDLRLATAGSIRTSRTKAWTARCRCTRCGMARSIGSASSWSARTRKSWATSTTCSATPTRSKCTSTATATR